MTAPGTVPPASGPARTPPPTRTIPPSLIVAVGVAVVALLVTAVWRLGGLEQRTDLLTTRPPGSVIETGPYAFTFTEATAQRRRGLDGELSWRLTAVGTGRTVGEEAMSPRLTGDDSLFASQDPGTGEIQVASGQRFGAAMSYADGAVFTPGLPAVEFRVDFAYPGSYRPGPTLRFVVWNQELRDPSLIGSEERVWRNANRGTQLYLPVRVLPDEV